MSLFVYVQVVGRILLTSASFVLSSVDLIIFLFVTRVRSAVEAKLAALAEGCSTAIDTTHEGLGLGMSILMLLQILLQRKPLRAVFTAKGLDT